MLIITYISGTYLYFYRYIKEIIKMHHQINNKTVVLYPCAAWVYNFKRGLYNVSKSFYETYDLIDLYDSIKVMPI